MRVTHTAWFERYDAGSEDDEIKLIVEQDYEDGLPGPTELSIFDADNKLLAILHAEEVYQFLRGLQI